MKNITFTAAILNLSFAVFAQDVMQPTTPKKPIPQMTDDDLTPAVKPAKTENQKLEKSNSQKQQSNIAIPENKNELKFNADPMEVINESIAKLSLIKSYRMLLQMAGSGNKTENLMYVEFQNPGRSYAYMGAEEQVEIEMTKWRKGKDGRWSMSEKQQDLKFEKSFEPMFRMFTSSSISSSDDMYGKIAVKNYTFTAPEKIGAGFPILKVLIGKRDGLPYLVEFGNTGAEIKTTYQIYDFNAPIKINPPKM